MHTETPSQTTRAPARACILGDASPEIWCDSAAGRLRRGLARAGIAEIVDEDALAGVAEAA
ncbi:MAG TPA: hypothetical protein VIR45_10595, partial [Kiloniellaceae bacterium]